MWIIKTGSLGPDPLFDLAQEPEPADPAWCGAGWSSLEPWGGWSWGSGVVVVPERRNMINSRALKRQVEQSSFQGSHLKQLSSVYLFFSISVRERMLFSG